MESWPVPAPLGGRTSSTDTDIFLRIAPTGDATSEWDASIMPMEITPSGFVKTAHKPSLRVLGSVTVTLMKVLVR